METNKSFMIEKEIKEKRSKFRVDHFDIILQEYYSKCKNGKLILNPPYQRKFRWDKKNQSALIESILLGIPLPPIFVFQKEDSTWELIDGLQRTSTIENFFKGILTLEGLDILEGLNGENINTLPESIIGKIENYRIRIELVEETDDIFSQYLLFNRLNSNGEELTDQEKRNFLIYKKNPSFFEKIKILAENSDFLSVLDWNSDDKKSKIEKQDNLEYLIKFFLARYFITEKREHCKYKDLNTLINKEIMTFLESSTPEKLEYEYSIFTKTFNYIVSILGSDVLKKNGKKANNIANRFTVTTGLSFLIEKEQHNNVNIQKIIENYYNSKTYERLTKSSYSPTKRIFELNKYSFSFIFGGKDDI